MTNYWSFKINILQKLIEVYYEITASEKCTYKHNTGTPRCSDIRIKIPNERTQTENAEVSAPTILDGVDTTAEHVQLHIHVHCTVYATINSVLITLCIRYNHIERKYL